MEEKSCTTGKLQSISKHFIGTGFTVVHLADEKLINSIAHKDAISALSGMVKMEAILSHVVLLATSIRRHHQNETHGCQTLKFSSL